MLMSEVLVNLIREIKPFYYDAQTNDWQKQKIQTIIGAGIWYFPRGRYLWTGNISIEAIKCFHPSSGKKEPKLTEEHQYPRKVAALKLLDRDWDKEENPSAKMSELYINKYGVINYVTSKENSNLKPFQKMDVFKSPEDTYQRAGIKLVKISNDQLKQIMKRNGNLIENLLDGNNLEDSNTTSRHIEDFRKSLLKIHPDTMDEIIENTRIRKQRKKTYRSQIRTKSIDADIKLFVDSIDAYRTTTNTRLFSRSNYFELQDFFFVIKISRSNTPFWAVRKNVIEFLNGNNTIYCLILLTSEKSGWVFNKNELNKMINNKNWNLRQADGNYKINYNSIQYSKNHFDSKSQFLGLIKNIL